MKLRWTSIVATLLGLVGIWVMRNRSVGSVKRYQRWSWLRRIRWNAFFGKAFTNVLAKQLMRRFRLVR
jgi:hypothetical protein